MFKKIMAAITTVITPVIGRTEYLDCMPFSGPVRGVDKAKRAFFSIPVFVTRTDSWESGFEEKDEGATMATFFQRYTEDPFYWVEIGNWVWAGKSPITHGSGWDPRKEAEWLEPILLRILAGETVTFSPPKHMHGYAKVVTTARLLTKAEIAKRQKSDEVEA